MSVTLAEIRVRADGTYPVEVLEHCRSALILFSSAFLGAQDGIFIADAGLTATCVDIRPERLNDMAAIYPSSWAFVVADAFDYAEACDQRFDLVSIDCPTNLFDRCAEMVDVWCGLACRAVILGTGRDTIVATPPEGWSVSGRVRRSDFKGGVFWTVLEPR